MWLIQPNMMYDATVDENSHLNMPSPSTSSQSSRLSFESETSGSSNTVTYPPSVPEECTDISNIPSTLSWATTYTSNFSPGGGCISYLPFNTGPHLVIREQPVEKFRFRYKSEMMGTHGSLLGRSSEKNRKKTYPTVELKNYNEAAVIRCSLYTMGSGADTNKYLHCHRLVVKQGNDDKDDPHDIRVSPETGYTATFQGMGIIHTAKKNIVSELIKKKQYRLKEMSCGKNMQLSQKEEIEIRMQAEEESKKINQNTVCLCFEALKENPITGCLEHICPPVFSAPVNNMKSALTGELKICRMDKHMSSVLGNEEVFMLVEKVGKKNIKIKFYELDDDDNEVWSDYGRFSELDVHHQYAIVFRTPPYRDLKTDKVVDVFVQLYRPTDGDCSEPLKFQYKPQDKFCIGEKRRRLDVDDIPTSVQNHEEYTVVAHIPKDSEISIDKLIEQIGNDTTPQLNSSEYQDYIRNFSGNVSGDFSGNFSGTFSGNFSEILGTLSRISNTDIQMDSESKSALHAHTYLDMRRMPRDCYADVQTDGDGDTSSSYIPGNNSKFSLSSKHLDDSKDYLSEEMSSDNWVYLSPIEETSVTKEITNELYHILHSGPRSNDLTNTVVNLFRKRSYDGEGPLHLAVKFKEADLVKNIMDILNSGSEKLKCYINDRDNFNRTPLHLAVLLNHHECIKILLNGGANPNLYDEEGNACLHLACKSSYINCLDYLLKHTMNCNTMEKLEVNLRNFQGLTPLHLAIRKRRLDSVALLTSVGANVNEQEPHNGDSPLHVAVQENNYHIVLFLLLQADIEIDKQNFSGNTPLHYACVVGGNGSPQICDLLLKNKADPFKKNFVKRQKKITRNIINNAVKSTTNETCKDETMKPELSMKELLVSLNSDVELCKEDDNEILESSDEESTDDNDGQSAFDLAAQNKEILQLLHTEVTLKKNSDNKDIQHDFSTDFISTLMSGSVMTLDNKTMSKLCSVLDTNKNWKNLCEILGYGYLIPVLEKVSYPAQQMLSYINNVQNITIKELRELVEVLAIMDAVAVIDELCVTVMEAKKLDRN